MTSRDRLVSGCLVAALAIATPLFAALPEHSERVVDYAISVRLDPEKKEISGVEKVKWRNRSTDVVGDLWIHLYWNAFRNNRSTFYVESGGQLRGDAAPADSWGWIDLEGFTLAEGDDLLPSLTFEHPDDDNGEDRTVARVVLPRPVEPGEEIELELRFRGRVPRVYARAGYMGDFFAVTQWFPKLGVYEPAGFRGREAGGWNCHQYHANSEFYADYGRFRVEMTVPSQFVVGATGPRLATTDNGDGTTTYVHEQSDVHDFAWSADPRFEEVVETFVAGDEVSDAELAAAARLVDRPPGEVRLRDVEIHLLMQPAHRPQIRSQLDAVKLALKWFGLWYGAYPYPTLTIIDPPGEARGAAGVEYPTLFFGGTSFVANYWPFSKLRLGEVTIVHEFGHQFWYGLVGSNEFEEAWLDEGFNTYSTAKVMDLGYGRDRSLIDLPGFALGTAEVDQMVNNRSRRVDRIATPSWKFARGQYSFSSYSRPALVLETLEGIVGEETMARILRTYHERYRYGHPSGEEFMAVASEIAGRDLDFYFDQVVRGPGVFDPAVTRILSRGAEEYRGRDESAKEPGIVSEEEVRKAERAADEEGRRNWHSEIELRQLGEVELPVEVELQFENREPERRVWQGDRRWEVWTWERPERLLSARLDPDGKMPLDANRMNNARRTFDDDRAAHALSVRFLSAVVRLLAGLGL
ncbi:MAG: M1 family metallopeptidase [Thermoanaerobaculia bacterium]